MLTPLRAPLKQYVTSKPAKQSNVIELLSDSDDPDILHDSHDEEEEDDGDVERRAVERLVQEAQMHAEDGHDVADLPSIPYSYIGAGMSYRGGWITTDDGEGDEQEKQRAEAAAAAEADADDDEEDNALESKTRSLTTQSARNAAEVGDITLSDSEEEIGDAGKRKRSPGREASAGRAKKAKTSASTAQSAAAPREYTCRECWADQTSFRDPS